MTTYFYESATTFPYSWEQVAIAYWNRYPNAFSKHVLTEDTISRNVTSNGCLLSKRLLTKTNRMPAWGRGFAAQRTVPILEESIVDPSSRTLTTYTRNIGLNSILSVVEKVVYCQNQDEGSLTTLEKSAWITSSLFGFSYPVAKFGFERYKKNANRASLGFLSVLATNFGEPSITHTTMMRTSEKVRQNLREAVIRAKAFAARARKGSPVFASEILDDDDSLDEDLHEHTSNKQ